MNTEIRHWQEKLFARSIRRRDKLNRIIGLTGKTSNMNCLEISSGDGVISASLRSLGGSWKSIASTKTVANTIGHYLDETVNFIEEGKLPFEDNTFDRVIIVDALKGMTDDYEFIRDCHRVLKNDGWVIISETRRAPMSLVALLQKLFGISPVAEGQQRSGYKAGELFNILKDGFDVPETICYSNSLLQSASTIGEYVQKTMMSKQDSGGSGNVDQYDINRFRRLHNLAGSAYPLLWLLSKMEFLPGHQLLVKSRRRPWRPRLQPKLIDGRSIAEAAINTKIGTAAPF